MSVNPIYRFVGFLSIFILLINLTDRSEAQSRVNYESLYNSSNQRQNIFVSNFVLPGDANDTVNFVTTFRISYNFLPFRKVQDPDSEYEFYSDAGMRIELFNAKEKVRRNRDQIKIEGLESAGLTSWRDTAFAETYEQTQSKNTFLTGALKSSLKPGLYNYILQMNRGNENRDESSRTRQVEIQDYEDQDASPIILVEELIENNGDVPQLNLLNFGNNAFYGSDFLAFVYIPDYSPDNNYRLTFHRADVSEDDTTRQDQVYSTEITSEQIYEDIKPTLNNDKDNLSLSLNSSNEGYTYALIEVPNSQFPNASYQLTIQNGDNTVARQIVRSIWLDMPISLLNLDVSIDMLKYMSDSETIRRINRGSERERERKFREFWQERDPTPDTEYNELMAEYYQRIDYAYERFTTPNTPGYESDRGKTYIRYGPPKNRERKFPTSGSSIEIWTYDDRKFVFESTSGFGDFKLIQQQ